MSKKKRFLNYDWSGLSGAAQGVYQSQGGVNPFNTSWGLTAEELLNMQWQQEMTSQAQGFQREMTLQAQQYQKDMQQLAWQHDEEMYNKYQSPQALVDQYKAAGINPMLAASGGMTVQPPASSSGSSAPSASAPSPGSPGASGDQNILSMIMDMFKGISGIAGTAANIDNTISQSRLTRAEAKGQELDNKIKEKYGELTAEQQYELLKSQVTVNAADASVKQKTYEWFDRIHQSQLDSEESERRVNESIESLNESQKDNLDKEWELLVKQIEQLTTQNSYDEAQLKLLNDTYDSYVTTAMSEARLSEKEAKWYAFNKIAGLIGDVVGAGATAASGAMGAGLIGRKVVGRIGFK